MEGELKQIAQRMLRIRPNFAYTIGEVKQDVQRIFNTGWFQECSPDAVDTRDGVRLVIKARFGQGGSLHAPETVPKCSFTSTHMRNPVL